MSSKVRRTSAESRERARAVLILALSSLHGAYPRLPRTPASTSAPLGDFLGRSAPPRGAPGGTMRRFTLLTAVVLAGCAHFAPQPVAKPATLTVSDDGRTATAGGEQWTAPEDVAFYQRGVVLHVVSMTPGRSWDVAVPLGPDGRLAWPAEGPIEAAAGALKVRASKATPAVAKLIDSGQIHLHDDHYHLTHLLEDEDWQALYRDRAEDSTLSPLRRQVAATVLALLLDERLPASPPEATEAALRRMESIIGKARRAVEGDVGARAIEAIITHDFEIRDDGKTLEIGGQRFRASSGIRFSYCATHFHVEDAGGKWAQPIELEGQQPGAFAWPASIFFAAGQDGSVAERTTTSRWRRLSDRGEVRFTRDHWHVTDSYAHPRLQLILKTISNPKVPEPLKDRARGLALEGMSLRLDTGSEAEFESRPGAIDQAIDRAAAALEKELRAAP